MNPSTRSHTKRTLYLIYFAALAAGAGSFLLPVVSSVKDPMVTHWRAAFSIVITVAMCSAATWFMASLGQFKERLRRVYVLLGVGLIIFSVAMAQLAVIGLLDQWDSVWATGGGIVLLFALGCIFAYTAMRLLSRMLNLHGLLPSFWAVTSISVVVGVLFGIVATYTLRYEMEGIATYIGAVAATALYLLCSALLAGRLRQAIGVRYQSVMRWQAIAFSAFALGALHEATTTIFFDANAWYEAYGVYLWPFVLTGLLFVRASYEFRLLTTQEVAAIASHEEPTDQDYIDTFVAVAGLASNPKEIDDIIEEMRVVTANLPPGSTMTVDQKKRLVAAYYQLEQYLTTKDPLRTYTKEEIREQATPGFLAVFNKY